MPNEPDNLLRVWDVANGLQIGEETIRRWLRSGRLRGILISRKAGWRIRESDLYAFLDTITKGKSYSWPHPWPIYAKEEYEPDDEEEVDAAEEGDGEYDEGVE